MATPSGQRLAPGTVLGHRYEIREHLESGGFGHVYAGVNLALGSEVAIKIQSRGPSERLLNEARRAARLKSPYAVRVFDAGMQDDLFYLVMERLHGISLAAHLRTHGKLAIDTALRWSQQICSALDEAHSLRLIHRDLKPSNVFVSQSASGERHCKLLDFGLAKPFSEARSDLSESGRLLGTPNYMSPEQIRGAMLTAQSDIWSMGVLLYEALTATRPFEGESTGATLVAIAADPARRLSDSGGTYPEELERIVARCLRKSPDERYPSALALSRDLAQVGSGQSLTGPRSAEPERTLSASTDGSIARSVPPTTRPSTLRQQGLWVAGVSLFFLLVWRVTASQRSQPDTTSGATPPPSGGVPSEREDRSFLEQEGLGPRDKTTLPPQAKPSPSSESSKSPFSAQGNTRSVSSSTAPPASVASAGRAWPQVAPLPLRPALLVAPGNTAPLPTATATAPRGAIITAPDF